MSDTLLKTGTTATKNRGFFLQDSEGNIVPAVVAFTTDGSGNIQPISSGGGSSSPDVVEIHRRNYSTSNVSTSAYSELIASTSAAINHLEIFDSSGRTLVLALGAAASEIDLLYVFKGGNGLINVNIPIGSRISIKAVDADATTGELCINAYS